MGPGGWVVGCERLKSQTTRGSIFLCLSCLMVTEWLPQLQVSHTNWTVLT